MARVNRTTGKTPDSGYQFICDGCESEVVQVPPPELVLAIEESGTGKNKSEQTVSYQCCMDCARQIKKENEAIIKARSSKQTYKLREGSEVAEAKPTKNERIDAVENKLDKLIELMTLQIQTQLQKGVSSEAIAKSMVSPPATTPKPKILAPPVKKNATRQAAKPNRAQAKATKPKSRQSR